MPSIKYIFCLIGTVILSHTSFSQKEIEIDTLLNEKGKISITNYSYKDSTDTVSYYFFHRKNRRYLMAVERIVDDSTYAMEEFEYSNKFNLESKRIEYISPNSQIVEFYRYNKRGKLHKKYIDFDPSNRREVYYFKQDELYLKQWFELESSSCSSCCPGTGEDYRSKFVLIKSEEY